MFVVAICWDRAGVGLAREKAHPSHLRYMAEHAKHVRGGGPLENANGGTVGTLFHLDFEDEAQARLFLDHEPFHQANCFEASLLRGYRQMQPVVSPESLPSRVRRPHFS